MNRHLESLESRSWPTYQARTLTYAAAAGIVLLSVGFAMFAGGVEPRDSLIVIGLAAVIVYYAGRRLWNVPKRRVDFGRQSLELDVPLGTAEYQKAVPFDDVTSVELRWHSVRRYKSAELCYWVLRVQTGRHSQPIRLESGDYHEFHRLLHLGRALADEIDTELDVGPTVFEVDGVHQQMESEWWNFTDSRVAMLVLIMGSVIAGFSVVAAASATSFSVLYGLAALAVCIVAFLFVAFYLYGRYHYPDQQGTHTVAAEPPDRVEISSSSPFFESRVYEADDLDAIAVHDGSRAAVFFVEADASRFLALPDEERAHELRDELRRALVADGRGEPSASQSTSDPEGW